MTKQEAIKRLENAIKSIEALPDDISIVNVMAEGYHYSDGASVHVDRYENYKCDDTALVSYADSKCLFSRVRETDEYNYIEAIDDNTLLYQLVKKS